MEIKERDWKNRREEEEEKRGDESNEQDRENDLHKTCNVLT